MMTYLNFPLPDRAIAEHECLNQEGEIVVAADGFSGERELGDDLCCSFAQHGHQLELVLYVDKEMQVLDAYNLEAVMR